MYICIAKYSYILIYFVLTYRCSIQNFNIISCRRFVQDIQTINFFAVKLIKFCHFSMYGGKYCLYDYVCSSMILASNYFILLALKSFIMTLFVTLFIQFMLYLWKLRKCCYLLGKNVWLFLTILIIWLYATIRFIFSLFVILRHQLSV